MDSSTFGETFSGQWSRHVATRGFAACSLARRAISGMEGHLSRREGVRTFSDDPKCILRYALTSAPVAIGLSDGVEIRRGDLVIDVHCWNERIPPMSQGGADLAWAHHVSSRLRASLQLLARAAETTPELREVRACRARVNFVGQGGSNASVSRIIARMGFEDVNEGSASAAARLHDALENIWISALVWTHNPEALRREKMIRQRRPVWSSRDKLLRLHGAGRS